MKKVFLPIMAMIIGEICLRNGNIFLGLLIYMSSLMFMTVVMLSNDKIQDVLQLFVLIFLLRIINFSIPRFEANIQYILLYVIMLIPTYYIMRIQRNKEKESYIYIPIAMAIGTINIIFDKLFNLDVPPDIGGKFTTIFLIIFIISSILLANTKYWNKYISDILNSISYSFLSIFIVITIFRITSAING